MLKEKKLDEIIEEAVWEFNKYRSPEITAKIISFEKNMLEVIFTGTFYLTCRFYDYFDDFTYILDDLGVKNRVISITELSNGAQVKYEIKL